MRRILTTFLLLLLLSSSLQPAQAASLTISGPVIAAVGEGWEYRISGPAGATVAISIDSRLIVRSGCVGTCVVPANGVLVIEVAAPTSPTADCPGTMTVTVASAGETATYTHQYASGYALLCEAAPVVRWLDQERIAITVAAASELRLVRGAWESPVLIRLDATGTVVVPDDIPGPRDADWQPQVGDQWCNAAGCSAPLDGARWIVAAPWVGR